MSQRVHLQWSDPVRRCQNHPNEVVLAGILSWSGVAFGENVGALEYTDSQGGCTRRLGSGEEEEYVAKVGLGCDEGSLLLYGWASITC